MSKGGAFLDRKIEKIVQAIKNKTVISFVYNYKDSYLHIHPYYLFTYNNNYYLAGLDKSGKKVKTYTIAKMSSVELAPLYFNEKPLSIYDCLKDSNFRLNIVQQEVNLEDVIKKIHVISSSSGGSRLERLTEYYINSLKKEQLSEMTIGLTSEIDFYKLRKPYCERIINPNNETKLHNNFTDVYSVWEKRIKKEPDLCIYLGYPLVKIGRNIFPFMFYMVQYDENQNTIKYNGGNVFLNGKFIDDVIELTDEEAIALKTKFLNNRSAEIDVLNKNISKYISEFNVLDYGALFLQTNTLATKGLISELKRIKEVNPKELLTPFKSIIKMQDESKKYPNNEHVFNIVEINKSQEAVIKDRQQEISLVQGPPGTGKTQTILNLVVNEILNGNRVLVTSMNNKAVNNIYEKLIEGNIFDGVLRLGKQELRKKSLQSVVQFLKREHPLFDNNVYSTLLNDSSKLKEQILKKEEILTIIEELEIKKDTLEKSYEHKSQEVFIRNISIEKIRNALELAEDSVNVRLKIIKFLSQISVNCEEKMEISRGKLIWRILSIFGIKHDVFQIKRFTKQIEKLGFNTEYFSSFEFIDSFHLEINNIITVMQLDMLQLEIDSILKKLEQLNKKQVINELRDLNKEKISNDKNLLKEYHKKLLMGMTNEQKHSLIRNLDNKSDISSVSIDEFKMITNIFPIIVCTNLSTPASIPFTEKFDLVIIDEASQCNIASSIPAIMRAHRIIIVGDNKQLNPVLRIDKKVDAHNFKEVGLAEEEYNNYSFASNSTFDIFSLLKKGKEIHLLNEHYRCEPEIIQFSNGKFYDNNLVIKTSKGQSDFSGIKGINVEGSAAYSTQGSKSANNNREIEAIFNNLITNYEILKDRTIGIITPFRKQRELIKEQIDDLAADEEIGELQHFFQGIEVGTVHTFQGDEKQIIFYSSVISQGIKDTTIRWINSSPNLINVAVTRAQECFIMVGDFEYIRKSKGIVSDLVDYIDNLSNQNEIIKFTNTYDAYKTIFNQPIESYVLRSVLNPYEDKLYLSLKQIMNTELNKYEIGIKVRVADIINVTPDIVGWDILFYAQKAHFDFIIFDRKTSIPVLAIELDGKHHKFDSKTKKNDAMKNGICAAFGLPLIRISTEAYPDNKELKGLLIEHIN